MNMGDEDMAIDVKHMLASSLIELCETKNLDLITIKDLLNDTGISRQTFYNHFLDKNDLIQYIYLNYIISDFDNKSMNIDFYTSLVKAFENMKKYKKFMQQACQIEGQNCLKDYIFQHCKEFDIKWHQELYGKKPMPLALKFATEYHATASSSMTLSWILSDMPVSCEEMAKMIVDMRAIGMDVLFQDADNPGNPYKKVDK